MAGKIGSLGNRECCSGALNPKVILGDTGGLRGAGLIKMPRSWRCGTAPGGCEKNGSSGLQIQPAGGSRWGGVRRGPLKPQDALRDDARLLFFLVHMSFFLF